MSRHLTLTSLAVIFGTFVGFGEGNIPAGVVAFVSVLIVDLIVNTGLR